METKNETTKCSNCGRPHRKTTSNCCWIYCTCGTTICGQCGSENIGSIETDEADDEAQYWCCQQCNDCGLMGCGMCI